MIDKIKNTGLAVIAAAFAIFGIWQIGLPVDEALVSQLWALIITLVGAFVGGGASQRVYLAWRYRVEFEQFLAIPTDKILNTGLAVIAAAFAIFGIWQINVPVDEALVSQLWALIITIISVFVNGSAIQRAWFAGR